MLQKYSIDFPLIKDDKLLMKPLLESCFQEFNLYEFARILYNSLNDSLKQDINLPLPPLRPY